MAHLLKQVMDVRLDFGPRANRATGTFRSTRLSSTFDIFVLVLSYH